MKTNQADAVKSGSYSKYQLSLVLEYDVEGLCCQFHIYRLSYSVLSS